MLEQIEQQDAQASQGSKANIGGSMQEGMDGFDPEIQREIQQRRQLLEKLKEQITLKRNEREQTKMIQMDQNAPNDEQDMQDGIRDGEDEQ